MTIVSVKKQPSGLFLVRDSDGETHATRSAWLASVADRARLAETSVLISSFRGWHYRELHAITPVAPVQASC